VRKYVLGSLSRIFCGGPTLTTRNVNLSAFASRQVRRCAIRWSLRLAETVAKCEPRINNGPTGEMSDGELDNIQAEDTNGQSTQIERDEAFCARMRALLWPLAIIPGVSAISPRCEKMLDKMSARCTASSVDSGPKKYIDGACILADADGDRSSLG
jgi:hypothetical protein